MRIPSTDGTITLDVEVSLTGLHSISIIFPPYPPLVIDKTSLVDGAKACLIQMVKDANPSGGKTA
jgi:hypothetical protein